MKRKIIFGVIILLCIGSTKIKPARAYTVTVQKDGMYAEVVPEIYLNNAGAIFRKSVSNSLKYYNKYKDAAPVTYNKKMPAEYRDFVDLAREIKDSDKIVITNVFFIYDQWHRSGQGGLCKYYFVVKKNGEKFCLFELTEDIETGEIIFWYDKVMDQYFKYDEKTMKDAIFYEIDSITYAETPDQVYEVRDQEDRGNMMAGSDESDQNKIEKSFKQKNYSDKKDEIFAYLKDKSGVSKKTKNKLKLELKDDYVESEDESKNAGISKVVYPAAGVACVIVAAAVIFFVRKRKKSSLS